MLVKEYRILIPLSVDEYRIAQLYMIQKKSRVDTSGAGSGVEILKNEPYEDGPGGKGQYTYKVYHIGSHLPASFRSILPESALRVEEEAWNAYPYTRTRFTCPFVERFSLDVTTVYYNDAGTQENVFDLKGTDLTQRNIDFMDFVKDPISVMDYSKEEDPKLYRSKKTKRGPLSDDWVRTFVEEGKPIMCAYKLCRVEFRYWGMQTRIEKFIHDIALRKTMLRAHRQAWAWQDEWYGLSIHDIRTLEKEAQEHLNAKMQAALEAEGQEAGSAPSESKGDTAESPNEVSESGGLSVSGQSRRDRWGQSSPRGSLRSQESGALQRDALEAIRSDSDDESEFFDCAESLEDSFTVDAFVAHRPNVVRWSSVEMLAIEEEDGSPPLTPVASSRTSGSCSTTLLVLVFHGGSAVDTPHLGLSQESLVPLPPPTPNSAAKQGDVQTFVGTLDSVVRTHYPQLWGRVAVRLVACPNFAAETIALLSSLSPYGGEQEGESGGRVEGCRDPALIPVLAADSSEYDDYVLSAIHRANQVFSDFLSSDEGLGFSGEVCIVGDALGGVLAYDALVKQRVSSLSRNPSQMSAKSDVTEASLSGIPIPEDEPLSESAFHSDDEKAPLLSNGFPLKRSRKVSAEPEESEGLEESTPIPPPDQSDELNGSVEESGGEYLSASGRKGGERLLPGKVAASRHLSAPDTLARVPGSLSPTQRRSMSSDTDGGTSIRGHRKGKMDFRVSSLFLLGSPLGLVLAHRRIARTSEAYAEGSPACNEVWNLYYAMDGSCARVEPLLCHPFSRLPPVNVPRYSRFPLGDGQSLHLLDCIQRHDEDLLSSLSSPEGMRQRKPSSASTTSEMDKSVGAAISAFQNITGKWWGCGRVDMALYCPEGLATLPRAALPALLHASFWESSDVAAFLIRQFVVGDDFTTGTDQSGKGGGASLTGIPLFTPAGPTEKWTKKRTSFKIKNATANHRANDIIVTEFQPQVLMARFMYGPLDVVALGGEKVDVYIKTETAGKWVLFGSDSTDNHGRLTYRIPEDKQLALGLYPVKMVVRGDHTYLDMFLAVVPPQTECIVFSIDGSFTASVSVTGKDPKVRPGAVDVVRQWQELGYLVLYITARPDMQQRKVISWLAQHNFPHGLLFFTDGISTDPLKQKTQYLKQLVDQRQLKVQAGYGSGKDVQVYSSAGVPPSNIFVVGKVSKKLQTQCQSLTEGYSVHLTLLTAGSLQTVARPAQGNGRLLIRKGCFSLPGQYRTVTVQRSQSFTPRTGKYGVHSSQHHQHQSGSLMTANSVGPELMRGVSVASGKRRGISPFRIISRGSTKHKPQAEE